MTKLRPLPSFENRGTRRAAERARIREKRSNEVAMSCKDGGTGRAITPRFGQKTRLAHPPAVVVVEKT